jgi:hypothetical protein
MRPVRRSMLPSCVCCRVVCVELCGLSMGSASAVFVTNGKVAADGVRAGRSFAWPDGVVLTLGGNVGNRVIGVAACFECGVVWIEVAEVRGFGGAADAGCGVGGVLIGSVGGVAVIWVAPAARVSGAGAAFVVAELSSS